MITILFVGAVTAFAVFAILAKVWAGGPQVAEKMEKGDIIKQLLALSELENRSAQTKRSAPAAKPQPDNVPRPAKSPETKPVEKASECLGC
jgi:hypothetical protein